MRSEPRPRFRQRSSRPMVLEQLEERCLPSYMITDLGTLEDPPDDVRSGALGINAAGQIAGWSHHFGYQHAFLYDEGVMHDLHTLPIRFSWGQALNDSGQVVGFFTDVQFPAAFLYSDGVMNDLGTLLGGYHSAAYGINNSGQAVGWSDTADNQRHAFLYDSGNSQDLGTFTGDGFSAAYGINVSGLVVGEANAVAGRQDAYHAFLWSDGTLTDLGTLPGAEQSTATAINALDQVVGYSGSHAFLWEKGVMHDLGNLFPYDFSIARAINGLGQVVGYRGFGSPLGSLRAFVYQDGTLTDLNDLLPAGSNWRLDRADGINDAGQIVGMGLNPEGHYHAFLLAPDKGQSDPRRIDPAGVEVLASNPTEAYPWRAEAVNAPKEQALTESTVSARAENNPPVTSVERHAADPLFSGHAGASPAATQLPWLPAIELDVLALTWLG